MGNTVIFKGRTVDVEEFVTLSNRIRQLENELYKLVAGTNGPDEGFTCEDMEDFMAILWKEARRKHGIECMYFESGNSWRTQMNLYWFEQDFEDVDKCPKLKEYMFGKS